MGKMLQNDEAKSNISRNVGRILEQRGWEQADLAEATGDTRMMISRVLRGLVMPNAAVLARIAEAFDVSVDRLLAPPPEKTLAK